MPKILPVLALAALLPTALHAQTMDDGIMLASRALFTGVLYTHDSWDQYWEGPLKRENHNVGTVTTEVNTYYANYGLTDRLNLIGVVPFVRTDASEGVLHGINGLQDLTLAAKYSFLEHTGSGGNRLRAIAVVSAAIPLTDYNIELPPLSIGSGSTRLSGRGTVNLQSVPGWFVNGSTAYTWRSETTLDRPYYFTDGEFVMSNQVDMPNVFDYVVSAGYMKPGRMLAGSLSQQRTLGGGDIRRQDVPFVSNRMNYTKLGALVMYPIPKLERLAFQLSFSSTIEGRNVGQANTFTTGLLYLFGSASR